MRQSEVSVCEEVDEEKKGNVTVGCPSPSIDDPPISFSFPHTHATHIHSAPVQEPARQAHHVHSGALAGGQAGKGPVCQETRGQLSNLGSLGSGWGWVGGSCKLGMGAGVASREGIRECVGGAWVCRLLASPADTIIPASRSRMSCSSLHIPASHVLCSLVTHTSSFAPILLSLPMPHQMPLVYAPILPLIRIGLRGRIPQRQIDIIFGAAVLTALGHAG